MYCDGQCKNLDEKKHKCKLTGERLWLFGHFHDDRWINDKAQMLFKNVIDLEFLKE